MGIDNFRCLDCGADKNYNGHSRCFPCRKAKRIADIAAGLKVDPNCAGCKRPLLDSEIHTFKRKCAQCRYRSLGTTRVKSSKPNKIKSIRWGMCQVCGSNKPSTITPDGTGVRCCEGCYLDCEKLMAVEAKRRLK